MKARHLLVAGVLTVFAGAGGWLAARAAQPPRVLRVCADPNNLPFSNEAGAGMENRLAELIAHELDARVEYTWWAQRRGFVRNTLRAERCDVIMGVPTSFELALTTDPYYRSTYVFVYRADAPFEVRSFDDSILRDVRVGVPIIGDDGYNPPPAHALGARGIVDNVRGYPVYGDYREPNPPARLIEAVAHGDIDVAVAWGPLAGWAAQQQDVPLVIVPVTPQIDLPFLPFVFDISLGVRREDVAFREELNAVLHARRAEIAALLDEYGVPRPAQEAR